ncbi:MAG: paraquat-inducible protein A [Akkermansiaceae bacterium]|nr:paraquat-inducible protein A [Akkermansiaceae bacterium]
MSQHHHYTWPRLPDVRHRVACEYCDTLHEVDLIEEGREAHCLECGFVLYRNRPSSLQKAVAFGTTALSLFVLVMWFPFISMNAQGNLSEVSIPGAVAALWREGGQLIAISVALFVIVFPAALIASLLYLCLPLLFGRSFPGSRRVMRWFLGVQSWVMVEVFFLGAIVSLLKLIKLADVQLGIGFWSSAGLMICLAGAVGGIDRTELWDRIETSEFDGKEKS